MSHETEIQEEQPAAAEPVKRRPGRPKGVAKTGGRYTPPVFTNAADARRWLIEKSNYIDFLARVAAGKPIACRGPTGKRLWHFPDMADRKWAISIIVDRCIPKVSANLHQLEEVEAGEAKKLEITIRKFYDGELGEPEAGGSAELIERRAEELASLRYGTPEPLPSRPVVRSLPAVVVEPLEEPEALHPETRNGATGRNHDRSQLRQLGKAEADRFTADTAAPMDTIDWCTICSVPRARCRHVTDGESRPDARAAHASYTKAQRPGRRYRGAA